MPVLPLVSAPIGAEFLRSASLRLDDSRTAHRAETRCHGIHVLPALFRWCVLHWYSPPSSVHSLPHSWFHLCPVFHSFHCVSADFIGFRQSIYRRKQGVFPKKHQKTYKKRRSFSPRFWHRSEVFPSPFCAGLPMGSSAQRDAHTGVLHRFSCFFLCFSGVFA